jgi:hypothetical protein
MQIDTDDPELRGIIERGRTDFAFFSRTFLRQTFFDTMSSQHLAVCEGMQNLTNPYQAYCAWRGFGKSTLIGAHIIHDILYRIQQFPLYVGAGFDLAVQKTEDIKVELCTNEVIRDVFGDIRPKADNSEVRYGFSKKAYYIVDPLTNEPMAFLMPKGAGQLVRGLSVRIGNVVIRPDGVYVDDLENDEDVWNDESRAKLRRWFNSALKHVVNRKRPYGSGEWKDKWRPSTVDPYWRPPWRLFFLDSLKHQDAMIIHLQQSPEWVFQMHPKAKLDGEKVWRSCVPEIVSDTTVQREIEIEKSNGTFDSYCREMLCVPSDAEDRMFTEDMFHYLDEDPTGPGWYRYIHVDPARSTGRRSARTGILAWAVHPQRGIVHITHERLERLKVDSIEDAIFELAADTNCQDIGIEDNGLSDWVHLWMQNAKSVRGKENIRFFWLDAGSIRRNSSGFGSGTGPNAVKQARCSLALPLFTPTAGYPNGHVFFHPRLKGGALQRHLLLYPDVLVWDLLDCMGYIPEVLANEGHVFSAKMYEDGDKKRPRASGYDRLGQGIRSGVWRVA